jgi:hypothetical protein
MSESKCYNKFIDNTAENINKKSFKTKSSLSNEYDSNNTHSDFTSISNMNIFPNSKLRILIMTLSIFDFLTILANIIYSFLDTNYILNISYLEKDQIDININNKDFISVFTINKYMVYILVFFFLIYEFIEIIILIISRKHLKILGKYVYIEMGYWFFVIKFLHGLIFISFMFHFLNFYLNFISSIILNIMIIGKIIINIIKKIFYYYLINYNIIL